MPLLRSCGRFLSTSNAPGQRAFSHCAASFFPAIRQYFCGKCLAQRKNLAAGTIVSWKNTPLKSPLFLFERRAKVLPVFVPDSVRRTGFACFAGRVGRKQKAPPMAVREAAEEKLRLFTGAVLTVRCSGKGRPQEHPAGGLVSVKLDGFGAHRGLQCAYPSRRRAR